MHGSHEARRGRLGEGTHLPMPELVNATSLPQPVPALPVQSPRDYHLGFEAGLRYASASKRSLALTADRKFFAAMTLTVGLGTAAAAVATITQSRWRYLFATFGIAGLLLGTVITTTRVLNGGPAPWEV